MLHTLYYQLFRNDEYIQFMKDIIYLCEQNNPDTLNIRVQFDALNAELLKLESGYLQSKGSELTDNIRDLDNVRDSYIIGITFMAKGYIHHYNPDFVEAGERLLGHIKKYGTNADSIASMNYQAETTALNDLIDLVKNDAKVLAAVTLLGLTEWFTKLEEQNDEFHRLFMSRVNESAEKPDFNLKELRAESLKQYRELSTHLTSNAVVSPSPLYDITIKNFNELIDKYNAIRR